MQISNMYIFEGFLKFGVKKPSSALQQLHTGIWTTEFTIVHFWKGWLHMNFVAWTVDQVKWLGTICTRRLQILETIMWIHFSGFMSSTSARAKNNQNIQCFNDSLDHIKYPKLLNITVIEISCFCMSFHVTTNARQCHRNQGTIFTHWTLDFWDNLTWMFDFQSWQVGRIGKTCWR